jgi:hypothetical protein
MPYDVFISYPHQNKTVADAACAKIEAAGIGCWIAPRDISPSAEWAASIIEAIDNCRVMVLVFSSYANQSRQVRREVQQAFDNEKPVIPFRIENIPPERALRFYMGSVHWLDALTPPVEQHLEKLVDSVAALVRAPASAQELESRQPQDAGARRQREGSGAPRRPAFRVDDEGRRDVNQEAGPAPRADRGVSQFHETLGPKEAHREARRLRPRWPATPRAALIGLLGIAASIGAVGVSLHPASHVPPAVPQMPSLTRSTQKEPRLPNAITQCESDQCTRGGGGAIWLFEGKRGQAMWHYGAIADLTVESFDGHTIVVSRSDPLGSYSSNYAPPGVNFIATYTGTISGNRIDGTVTWMKSTHGVWYAAIPKMLCDSVTECPLSADQVLALGQNAARAGLYCAARLAFSVAARLGNDTARGLAGGLTKLGDCS